MWFFFVSMKKDDTKTKKRLENIGNRLKKLRKARGYSNYEQFAYQNNIGRAQYGRYEKGSDMRISSLLKVLDALEITPAEFFSEDFSIIDE